MNDGFKVTANVETFVVRSLVNAVTGQEEEWLELEGVASDDTVDQLDGKFHTECQFEMARAINDGSDAIPVFGNERIARSATQRDPVGVDIDHSNRWNDQIGYVTWAEVRRGPHGENQLVVRMLVDLGMSAGKDLKRALEQGKKLGLSIFGKVGKMYKQVERSTGKIVENFKSVDLRRIAITSQPVNKNTWVSTVRRSLTEGDMEETEIEAGGAEAPAPVEEVTTTVETVARSEEAAVESETTDGQTTATAEVPAETRSVADQLFAARSLVAAAIGEENLGAWDALIDQTLRGDNTTSETPETPAEGVGGEEVARSVEGLSAAAAAQIGMSDATQEAEGGLSAAALAQLGGLVPQAPVPAPAPAPAEQVVETVERALPEGDEGDDVYRAMREEIVTLRSLLAPLPDFIKATKATFTMLREEIDALVETVESLTSQPTGRRSSVARSMQDETAGEGDTWNSLPPAQRAARLREASDKGLATAVLFGLVPAEQLSPAAKRQIQGN